MEQLLFLSPPPPCSTAMVAIESGELFSSESKSMTAYLKIESTVMPQCECHHKRLSHGHAVKSRRKQDVCTP